MNQPTGSALSTIGHFVPQTLPASGASPSWIARRAGLIAPSPAWRSADTCSAILSGLSVVGVEKLNVPRCRLQTKIARRATRRVGLRGTRTLADRMPAMPKLRVSRAAVVDDDISIAKPQSVNR